MTKRNSNAIRSESSIKHIAIAGNIGSGKTTLTRMLCKSFKWVPVFETVEENPYLSDFYNDMSRWSFNLQIYFLSQRFKKLIEIQNYDSIIVQDRTIYEDVYIFATNLKDMGLMSERDYNTYVEQFELMNKLIQPPHLLIYLKANTSTLVEQIQKRGREYEENISISYLKRLNEYYDSWAKTYDFGKILTINVDNLRFEDNSENFSKLVQKVQAEINGLF